MKNLAIVLSVLILTLTGCAATQQDVGDQAVSRGDYPTALAAYQAEAAKGDSWAELKLGALYDSGSGVPKDPATARSWYVKSAQDGNGIADVILGDESQYGPTHDYADAFRWYKAAGDSIQLMVFYENGLGTPKDDDLAMHWLNDYIAHTNVVGQKISYKFSSGGDNTGGFISAVLRVVTLAFEHSDLRSFGVESVLLSFHYQDGRATDVKVDHSSGNPAADAAAVAFLQRTYLPPVLPSLTHVDRFQLDLGFQVFHPMGLYEVASH